MEKSYFKYTTGHNTKDRILRCSESLKWYEKRMKAVEDEIIDLKLEFQNIENNKILKNKLIKGYLVSLFI